MFVCVHVFVCVHLFVCECVSVCTYACLYMCLCTKEQHIEFKKMLPTGETIVT